MSKSFDGFEGAIGVVKLSGRLHYFFIGEARKFSDSGSLIVTMKSDSLGYLQSYFEIDPKDSIIFDCVYEYQKINGILLRIETQKLYYGPGQLWEEGQRFIKMTDEGIGNRYATLLPKAFGEWKYYTRSGEIEKIKNFGKLE